MNKSNSNIKVTLIILFSLSLFSDSLTSQIAISLWSKELLGSIRSLKFASENDIIATSSRGIFSKINSNNGDIQWRKPNLYDGEFEIEATEHYSLIVNRKDSYANLIDNTNAQLTLSIGLQDTKSEKDIKYGIIHLSNNKLIAVFANESHMKIFNRERSLAEFEGKNEKYADFFIDPTTEKLNILSLEEKKAEVLQVNLGKITKKADNKLKSLDISFGNEIKYTVITRNFLLILTGEKYFALKYSSETAAPIEGMFNYAFDGKEKIFNFKYSDKIVLVKGNQIQILTLRERSVDISLLEEKIIDSMTIFDKIDTKSESSLFFIRKKNANTFNLKQLDLTFSSSYSIQEVSSFNINEEFSLSTFSHSPFNKQFIVTTLQNRIYYFDSHIQSASWTIDNSLSKIKFSELVTYYDELGKEREDVQYHTRIDGLINQKELSNVIVNTITLVYKDCIQICRSMFEAAVSLIGGNRKESGRSNININSNSNINTSIQINHSLIIFTESEELVVIDALTGVIHFSKLFKNKSAYKIIRNTDEDMNKNANDHIYIIFRDTKTKILSGVKLNLRTIELEEDIMVLNDLLQEEEIKLQCQSLVAGDISSYNTSLTLSKNFNKNIIDKYDGKVAIESKDNSIYGIRFTRNSNGHLDLNIVWNFNIPKNQMVVMYDFPNVHKNVITTYLVNGKIYYRFIDSNMMALLTKIDKKHLLITLIRTSNGKVIHQNQINNVDLTSMDNIKLVFEENFLLVSYVKKEKGFTRNEIFALEIMKREIEHSFIFLLEKVFKFGEYDMKTEDIENNVNNNNIQESDLVVLWQSFILPRKVKKISVSKSQLNVANKFLIVVFENNQVFLVDRRGVSPRRPVMKEDKSKGTPPVFDELLNSPYVDPDLAGYYPIIALDPKSVMNVEFTNNVIDELKVTPSQYESTFILCTVGANVGCLKVFPDKMFDSLNLQFAYSLIGSFLVGIITAAYLVRRYVKRIEFKNMFLISS